MYVLRDEVAYIRLEGGIELVLNPYGDWHELDVKAPKTAPKIKNRYLIATAPLRWSGETANARLQYRHFSDARGRVGFGVSAFGVYDMTPQGRYPYRLHELLVYPTVTARYFVNNVNMFVNADAGIGAHAIFAHYYDGECFVAAATTIHVDVGVEFLLSRRKNIALNLSLNTFASSMSGGVLLTAGFSFGR